MMPCLDQRFQLSSPQAKLIGDIILALMAIIEDGRSSKTRKTTSKSAGDINEIWPKRSVSFNFLFIFLEKLFDILHCT
jgi:hypothetical protein